MGLLIALCGLLVAADGDAAMEALREACYVWVEAESVEPGEGLALDKAKAGVSSGGVVLGVHSDQARGLTCQWAFTLDQAVPDARLLLRYATESAGAYTLAVDEEAVGLVRLPPTGGWGYAHSEWVWGQVCLGRDLSPGGHTIELRAGAASRPVNIDCLAFARPTVPISLTLETVASLPSVDLPPYEPTEEDVAARFRLGQGTQEARIWGRAPQKYVRVYFEEHLPALFDRRLVFEEIQLESGSLEWIFTGECGGFTVTLSGDRVSAAERFYDSFGHNELDDGGKLVASRHPEKQWRKAVCGYSGEVRELRVVMDHRLQLAVLLNGSEVLRMPCLLDVSRHQLSYRGEKGAVAGALVRPKAQDTIVRVLPAERRQRMVGFGGIATPTAYAELSEEGKRQWWALVCEYNLLIQREYPNGVRLNPAMDNWDRLADATPHYYGDNFPNGEISDFEYLKTLRSLGGQVWFEFWGLPPWATQDWTDSDGKTHTGVPEPKRYAEAMVNYCRVSQERAGAAPDVVGMQNEVRQPASLWHEMAVVLRRELDRAGFDAVQIHLTDDGTVGGGLKRAGAIKNSAEAWAVIDYAATHMYDYQKHFMDPDGFDPVLEQWHALTGDKPFLSSELCINNPRYQWPSYRVAFTMGQLYHKNLALCDAAALCYCWTLLNVVQPSYGWTRSLMAPDAAHGLVPAATSHQLRVFGAYSRRIRAGMMRVRTESGDPHLFTSAFVSEEGDAATVVVLNRGTTPARVTLEGCPAMLHEIEVADPYHENDTQPFEGLPVEVAPGAIVTLTNVPLGQLPEGFPPGH